MFNLPTSEPFYSATTHNENRYGTYYASAYNMVETNQPPIDLFITSMGYLV